MTTTSVTLLIALVLFIALVLVLPLLRQRVRTGGWAIVVRDGSTSVEALVRWWTLGLFGSVAAWTLVVAAVGIERVGAWPVPDPLLWIGVGVMAMGFAIVVAAQAQMGASWRIGIDDEPTELVQSGLYRWVRHPIYTGILALFVGITCVTPAAWTISGFAVAYLLIAIQSRLEEEHMRAQHGASYDRWAARTGRFLPGLGRRNDAA